MFLDRLDGQLIDQNANQGHDDDCKRDCKKRVKAKAGTKGVDQISRYHIEGCVGNINDSRHAKDQGKPHCQQGINPTMNQPVDENVFNHMVS